MGSSTKFIVVAIALVIGLALTPVVAQQVTTITACARTVAAGVVTCPYGTGATGIDAGIQSLINLVPLAYVAALLLTPVYIVFKSKKGM